jgi:hypothetical protein
VREIHEYDSGIAPPLGIALARLLADKLFDVGYADPASWCASLALVAVIALFAC